MVGTVKRTAARATGSSVGPGRQRPSIEVKVPEDGSINLRKAENGVVVTVWDSTKKFDDPEHERTFVVDKVGDITFK